MSIITEPNNEMIFRIFVSVLLGFIVGLERELTSKSAGLRTHILVCLGSTVFTILSIYAFPAMAIGMGKVGDPGRVAAQILTGIGFIGAGTVMRHGSSVSGLTTAATLWITASIGMAIGAGKFEIGLFCAVLTVVVLTAIRTFENIFIRKIAHKGAKIKATIVLKPENASKLVEFLTHTFDNISELKQEKCDRESENIKVTIIFNVFTKTPVSTVHEKITTFAEMETFYVREIAPE